MFRPSASVSRQRFRVKICSMKVSRSTRIVQPPLFLDRQQGKVPGESPGEQTHAFLFRHALRVVHLDPHEAAAGGVALEDKPAEVLRFEFPDTFFGPAQHAIGVVDVGAGGDEARGFRVTDQTQCLPGDGETGLYLGADRNEIQVFAQRVREVTVVLVAAVKPDRLPEKAGADADPDLVFHFHSPFQDFTPSTLMSSQKAQYLH